MQVSRTGMKLFRSAHRVLSDQRFNGPCRLLSGIARGRVQAAKSAEESCSSIYNHPKLYNEAFSYRVIVDEVLFIKEAYRKYCPEKGLQRVLELGCGPAWHLRCLAAEGLRCWGLDQNPLMLDYALELCSKQGVEVQLLKGDMRNFDIKDSTGGPVDLVLCLLGTFTHMMTNEDACACLRCVGDHLAPGGLLVLELGHPGDLFDGTYISGDCGVDEWEVKGEDGRKLLVTWGDEVDPFDPVSQVVQRSVVITATRGEEVEEEVEDVVLARQYTSQEVDLLARLCGYKVVGMFGEMLLDVALDHEDAYRMIACLKKDS